MDVVKQKINKDVVEKSEMLCVPSIFIVLYDYFFNESGNYRYIFGRYFFQACIFYEFAINSVLEDMAWFISVFFCDRDEFLA